jgi:hypothetical protein
MFTCRLPLTCPLPCFAFFCLILLDCQLACFSTCLNASPLTALLATVTGWLVSLFAYSMLICPVFLPTSQIYVSTLLACWPTYSPDLSVSQMSCLPICCSSLMPDFALFCLLVSWIVPPFAYMRTRLPHRLPQKPSGLFPYLLVSMLACRLVLPTGPMDFALLACYPACLLSRLLAVPLTTPTGLSTNWHVSPFACLPVGLHHPLLCLPAAFFVMF